MSDGNYNRNLLPYHDYRSGLRAGRAAMRSLALQAFSRYLSQHVSDENLRAEAMETFRAELSGR